MLILLSPAKKMKEERDTTLATTRPRLKADVDELVKVAKGLNPDDLKSLMGISDDLAELNADRFKAFSARSNSARPAGLLFDGDVYWGFDAETLDDDGLNAAQERVRILSGLYGVLRPLDRIQPYRLEMGTKLKTTRGASLYEFWDDRIGKRLRDDLKGHDDKRVLNLASNEYFKAVDEDALKTDVVSAKFLNIKDGKARNLQYYAKHGRGQLARFLVDERADRVEAAKDFNRDGYRFDAKQSSAREWVFTRKQPPPKSAR